MPFLPLLFAFSLLFCSTATLAAPSLENTLNRLTSLHAYFLQTDEDSQSRDQKTAKGELWVDVPGKFRWYTKGQEEEQLIVADGKQLWLYDIPLAQISVYDQLEALTHSPAIILSNPSEVKLHFQVTQLSADHSSARYQLRPKKENYLFDELELFIEGDQLTELTLLKRDGSKTLFNLFYESYNQPIDSDQFLFTPPDNVDIIK